MPSYGGGMNDTDAIAARKRALRAAALRRRRGTDVAERWAAGECLTVALRGSGLLDGVCGRRIAEHPTVAAYVSMGTEIETRPLLGLLLERGVRVLVPRLGRGLDVGWSELAALDGLRDPGRCGGGSRRPAEPVDAPVLESAEALRDVDLVLLPALAVSTANGARLGRGGGWYDRALTAMARNCGLVAVCWPWEVTDRALPSEPHDVPVDAVLTPDGITMIGVSPA